MNIQFLFTSQTNSSKKIRRIQNASKFEKKKNWQLETNSYIYIQKQFEIDICICIIIYVITYIYNIYV